jgi:hypothetical protein
MTIFHVIKYGDTNPAITRADGYSSNVVPYPIWVDLHIWYIEIGNKLLFDSPISEYHSMKKIKLHELLLEYNGSL